MGVISLYPQPTDAASLYIDPYSSSLHRGDSETLSVRLDVDENTGECINAIDAVIKYSPNIEPIDVSTGDSIFNVWVEQPVINRENKTITFAGGIPNGYCGRVIGDPRLTNTLAKIVFQLPGFTIGGSGDSEATVSFSDETTAYMNDGRGTKALLTTYGAKISLDSKPGSALQNPWQSEVNADNISPEAFSVSLEKNQQAFSGKYFIVFSTTDKQTGIDHYEVMEESLAQFGSFQWGRADAPWIEARSPYVLKDQSLNSIIRVKAVDKAGNERIANLIPDESIRTFSHEQMIMIVFVLTCLISLILFVVVIVSLRRRKRRRVMQHEGVVKTQDDENKDIESYES